MGHTKDCAGVRRAQKHHHVLFRNSDATGSVRGVGFTKMEKDGAAKRGPRRRVIMAKNDDEVIKPVFTPQPLMRSGKGKIHRHVVTGVVGIITPAHRGCQRDGGKVDLGQGNAVRPIIDIAQRPVAKRCRHVTLALVRRRQKAGLSDKTGRGMMRGIEAKAVTFARNGPDGHGVICLLLSCVPASVPAIVLSSVPGNVSASVTVTDMICLYWTTRHSLVSTIKTSRCWEV